MLHRAFNAAAGTLVIALTVYAALNGSGHTGFPILALVPLYLIHLGYNVVGLMLREGTAAFRLGIMIDCFGLVLPLFLHFFGLLVQYEDWIRTGMPAPPSWRLPFLGLYCISFAAAVLISYKRFGRERSIC